MWAIVGVVPVVAVGTAYGMGAFSVSKTAAPRSTSFMGDLPSDDPIQPGTTTPYGTFGGKHKSKTKKSKKHYKKTIRRK